ncbi:MAG: DinB family protein [Candidatus Hermodarchaeota archaeon]
MSKLESIQQQLNYALNFAMKTLDKAITLIPDEKLDWKPVEDAMTTADLAIHIYMCSLVYMAGTLKGEFSNDDYSIIPFNSKNVKSASEIVDYGEKVKNYIKENMSKLTEPDMEKKITYSCWGGVKIGGFESLATILEEVIHHRGQLCIYLRMNGIKPPFIYDFS